MESTTEVQPQVTSNIFGLLALRQARTDRAAGIRRVTPRVTLLLDCYRLYRQKEIEALSPLEWMRYTLAATRAEVKALSEAAQASNDLATVAATLARVELLTGYIEFLAGKLEEMVLEGVTDA